MNVYLGLALLIGGVISAGLVLPPVLFAMGY